MIPFPEVEGVRHSDVVVRGLRLHVAEAGDPDAEAVVLQHGWPQHWWEWRHVIPVLAERYHVVCPDLRGFGWSDPPPDGDYRKESLVDDLLGILRELGIDRIRYVGHDWGAFLGYLLALRPDNPAERMVLMSVLPPWPPPGGVDLKRLAKLAYQLPIVAPAPGPFRTGVSEKLLRIGRSDEGFTDEEVETFLTPLRLPHGPGATAGMYRTFLRHELYPISRGKYLKRRLSIPLRVLIGKKDLFYDGAFEQMVRHNADQVEVEPIDGAHFIAEECAHLVTERVLDFFAKTPSETQTPA
ncbi:MAG TPA: alpha/beta hydrolase [Thermoleophilaceae bacterium]|nr:alpha/beta hydrolase [Thermoleophilaceae bacterium]